MIVLSDIHANLPALEAVLEDAEGEEFLFLGDLVGYYTWPNEVVETAREKGFVGVRGNHDEALVTGSTFGFRGEAVQAVRWTRKRIEDENLDYLENLPYTRKEGHGGRTVFMAHGSPENPVEEYVHPSQATERFLERQGVETDILLLGHTHIPFVREVSDTLVLNPGSVGQPRDGDPRASYATLDLDEYEARIHRVEYDIGRVQEAVEEEGLPHVLGDRLEAGR
ncbi:MAG: metallophosphoesterase [Candidatus Nanohaloarchaea archaeon]